MKGGRERVVAATIAAAAAFAIVAGMFDPAWARATPVCGPAAETLVAGRDARVYRTRSAGGERMTLGCVPGRMPRRLDFPREANTSWEGRSRPWVESEPIALHAPWVGYLENFVNVDVGDMQVAALNLRTGKFRYCDVGRWSSVAEIWFRMTGIVVTKRGNVGWIGEQRSFEDHENLVFACEGSRRRLLDHGEGIALKSLSLSEPFVHWINEGSVKSARLR